MNSHQVKRLRTAAMWLCCEVATHSLECTCGSCVAALEALPLLPELAPKYKEQFERRKAVTEFVKARDATPTQPPTPAQTPSPSTPRDTAAPPTPDTE